MAMMSESPYCIGKCLDPSQCRANKDSTSDAVHKHTTFLSLSVCLSLSLSLCMYVSAHVCVKQVNLVDLSIFLKIRRKDTFVCPRSPLLLQAWSAPVPFSQQPAQT